MCRRAHGASGAMGSRAYRLSQKRCTESKDTKITRGRSHLTQNELPELPQTLKKNLAIALDGCCFETSRYLVTIQPLTIRNCNAADSQVGISFSKAYCDVSVEGKRSFLFGDVFRRGLDIIINYLENNEVPDNKQEQFVLGKLLSFIKFFAEVDPVFANPANLEMLTGKELAILLSNHLFGNLSTSSRYMINKNCVDNQRDDCVCRQPGCKLTGTFGDTSMGNSEVWHGSADIIINNEVIVHLIQDESESLDGRSTGEMRIKSLSLFRNPQIIAQTIVSSFLQKQTHPERDHFLTPCIGVLGSCDMIVMFYDSLHDVLLESSRIPLCEVSEHEHTKKSYSLNLTAVIVSWLVINYKYLSSGLTKNMRCTYKADFFAQARDKLEVYEGRLNLGNVVAPASLGGRHKDEFSEEVICSTYLYKKHRELSRLIFNRSRSESSDECN